MTVTLYPFTGEIDESQVPLRGDSLRGTLYIVINPGSALAANPAALAAFNRAAAKWESYFSDPITVTIAADLQNLGPTTVIGRTDVVALGIGDYAGLRSVWILDADGDDGILASLPTLAQRSFTVPAGSTLSADTVGAKANLKAIGGFGDLDGMFGATDATIVFNTQFPFDYDNSNGVGAGLVDFETVAAHEIGHALGFRSGVEEIDEAGGASGTYPPWTLDYFRFLDGSANDPASAADFSTKSRDLRTNVNAITDFITAVATEAVENRMSTGKFTGDGRQASYWKDDELTGTRLGIMDPTLPSQQVWTITDADRRALDLIGYDLVLEDCTLNGVDDDDDLASGTSQDCNGNGTPDECETRVLDQSNTPPGQYGSNPMLPSSLAGQTFQPSQPSLGGVDISVVSPFPGSFSTTVSVQIFRNAEELASASQVVNGPFTGILHFDLGSIPVVPGETLILMAQEPTASISWEYYLDTYPNGQRYFFGAPTPGYDWIFRTYAAVDDCNNDQVPDECQLDGDDCNGNGAPDSCDVGIVYGDQYAVTANLPIPDNNATGVSSTITVPDIGVVTDLNIGLHINHTFQGDLNVALEHNGVSVLLIRRVGTSMVGCTANPAGYYADNFGSAGNPLILDDEAATEISCYAGSDLAGINNYAGPAQPYEALSAFNGMDLSGDWTLTVSDHYQADIGSLVRWELIVESTPSADCTGDGVPDECQQATPGRVLYCPSEPDDPAFRGQVAALTGAPADYLDARSTTPSLATLRQYDAVFTWADFAYADKFAMGDVLADYVDAGGTVILGQWCLPTAGNFLAGRIMDPAGPYLPVSGTTAGSGTYAGDGTGCATAGVLGYSTPYRDDVALRPGAVTDGTYTDGVPFVARPGANVVYVSGLMASFYGESGDKAQLVANLSACLKPSADANGDGTVDATDYLLFEECLSGPNTPPGPTVEACGNFCLEAFDTDHDGDVDLEDAGNFARVFNP